MTRRACYKMNMKRRGGTDIHEHCDNSKSMDLDGFGLSKARMSIASTARASAQEERPMSGSWPVETHSSVHVIASNSTVHLSVAVSAVLFTCLPLYPSHY